MNCPIDNEILLMSDKHGIEIDYCPKCRGVWLDRGELDKIIEKSSTSSESANQSFSSSSHQKPHQNHSYNNHDDYKYKKKKKENFLGELFDF